ncbi:hypothetical protein [uncultured Microscilla sp.]|uniref:hypothetical protein n=1 Tax=uncultured Microscilla sp. TaxID=432653 RepID=UPI00260FB11A|nr:hypothetical protein [uncultured Microscilla sp.]
MANFYDKGKATYLEELRQQVADLYAQKHRITAVWDCGGDETIVRLLLDGQALCDSYPVLCEKLRDLLIEKLQLPNTGEYYNQGRGWLELDQYAHVFVCYDAVGYQRDSADATPLERKVKNVTLALFEDYLGKAFEKNFHQTFSATFAPGVTVLPHSKIFAFSGGDHRLPEMLPDSFFTALKTLTMPYFTEAYQSRGEAWTNFEPQISLHGTIDHQGVKIAQVRTSFVEVTERKKYSKKLLIGWEF